MQTWLKNICHKDAKRQLYMQKYQEKDIFIKS